MNRMTAFKVVLLAMGALASLGLCGRAEGAVGTIMLVVVNSASLTAQESARKTLFEGWGYTVTPISATASAGTFTTSIQAASVAYVSETITDTDLNTKLKSATIGVICEENGLCDDFGFSSATTAFNATAIDVINTTHYITSTFASGSLTILSSSNRLMYVSGTLGTHTKLCEQAASSSGALLIMERGDALYGGGTAAGRRVWLPWRGSGGSFDFNNLTSDGQTLVKRSIEWCLMPVAYYKLDDASGTTAVDSISARNGTLVNTPTWSTGKLSGGIRFNGTDEYVSIANHVQFQVTNALTITGWIKGNSWSSVDDVAIVLRKGDANPNNWQLSICNGKLECTLDGSDNAGYKGNTTLTTGVWHHVAVSWDGSKVRLYLDGVLDNTPPTDTGPIATDTRVVYLGGRISTTDVLDGWLDEVKFFNRGLLAAEIAAMASVSPTVTSWENVAP